tara:strand:+ start:2929 stop:3120 length:192 start_codon:yes stop_codon:yes gene_type:complete
MSKPNLSLQKAITASYTLLGSLAFFGVIGYILNNRFSNFFWLIGCLIVGAIVGLYELYKQINR